MIVTRAMRSTIRPGGRPGKGARESPLHDRPGREGGGRTAAVRGYRGLVGPITVPRSDMVTRRLGTSGPEVGPIAFGAMSFAGYYGPAEDAEGIRAIHRALEAGHDADRHGRDLRGRPQRGDGRPGAGRPARPGGARHEVEQGRAGLPARCRREEPDAARRGPHRPLLPAPGRSRGADRGVGGRDGPAGGGGQRAPHRPLGGGPGDDPARPRRAPDRRAPERVLPAQPRAGARAAAGHARARHRLRRLQPALARSARRAHPQRRRPRARRLAPPGAALPGREPRRATSR